MSSTRLKKILKKTKAALILLISAFLFFPASLYALPEGEAIVEGAASFDRSTPNVLKINTSSDKLIVNYNSFSIAINESVYFYQPSVTSSALNRVTGSEVSNIFGTLIANGIIYLSNPNGINIGSTANINTASFIASTLNISNADFVSGVYAFSKLEGKVGKPVINQGYIKVREGGRVALLGSAVVNSGTIEATLGSVALAAGEKITLNLDSAGMISVVIDEPVKEAIYGFGGEKLDSAVQNSGKILAPGGKVILAAKVLNNVFDNAINNSGIIQAQSLVSHDGVVELVGEGAPVVNTGTIEAGEVKVAVKDADFINKGEIIARGREDAPASGNIQVTAANVVISEDALFSAKTLVDINAITSVKVVGYIQNDSTSMQSGEQETTMPGIIIQANQVKISAKEFGTISIPLAIKANEIYISRSEGNIEILSSLGIGTNILLRGPPEGFGAIIYNKDVKILTLETKIGDIKVSKGVFVFSDGILSLKSNQNIISEGSLTASDKIVLLAGGNIVSLGELKAPFLTEKGATFTVGGLYDIGKASLQNADNAVNLTTGNYSGETADIANIVVNNNAVITLIGNTIFRADSDQNGTGAFTMNNGSSIVGGGFDLTLYASDASALRAISGVGTLTINESQAGSNPTYTTNNNISLTNLTINSGIFSIGNTSPTISGTTTISGTLRITSTTGTKTFGNIIVNNGGAFTFTANEAITINGNLEVNGTGSITSGTGVWTFQKSGGSGTISGTAAAVSITNATFTTSYTNSISTLTIGTLTITGTTLTNNGTLTVNTALTGTGGITQGLNSTLNLGQSTAVGITTFDVSATGNTVNYSRAGAQTIKSATYYNLTLSGSGNKTAGGALTVNGDLTTSGTAVFVYGAFTHNFAGNWIINSTAAAPITATAGSTINFNTPGTPAATSISGATTATIPFVNININNTSGFSTTKNLSASGTFTVASDVVFTPGAANIISGAGTLTGNGTVQVTRTAATADFSSQYTITNKTLTNLTVEYAGASAQTVSAITYGNLKINMAGQTASLAGNVIVTNNLTITAGTLSAGANSITVGGNWSNSGTFNAGTGTVIFNDNTKVSTISGSSTFFNFSSTTAGKQITFTAGTTQTISGTLTLTGASGNLIVLRSTVSGSQWSINPQGSRSVSFVDVKDSNNTNATAINAITSTDSGNNTNWNFGTVDHFVITGSASQDAGSSNQLTITAVDSVGATVTSFTGDQVLVFSGANSIGSFTPTVTDKNGTAVNFGSNTTITFTSGVSSAGGLMVLYKAESASIAATKGSIATPSALSVTVNPAAAASLRVTGTATQTAGSNNELTITAFDAYGNTNSSGPNNYSGVKSLTFSGLSNAPAGNIPSVEGVNFGSAVNITFTNGVSNANSATLIAFSAESASVDVTDGAINSSGGSSFDLDLTVNPAAAAKLLFGQQPSNAVFDAVIVPAITVQVADQFNNLLSSDNLTSVTIAIGTNPSGGSISGTLTRTSVNRVASFNDLSIGLAGTGYTLTAASAGLTSATSDTFNITGTTVTPAPSTPDSSAPASSATASSAAAVVSEEQQLLNSLLNWPLLPSLQDLSQYQINTFMPLGPVYLYHPLTPADISAFEEIERKKEK